MQLSGAGMIFATKCYLFISSFMVLSTQLEKITKKFSYSYNYISGLVDTVLTVLMGICFFSMRQ